ncbi:AAA family ATPase [Spirulina sp. CS-785/01]|uniref:AAA family ATPase n=1 Tax=Spirulina sp. CS-785/01 TaxID=3021716 RepID=UPI00232F1814|nr:AAA family ATPase [Spirulina sp. CS-785/01]MDB9313592.1 AAA family ATPase [Spirulina sp. CS-785/01]
MGLQLEKMTLHNWKCYQDQTIEFDLSFQDETKNVWIIFGQNGFGKTSILEALQWCLYGTGAVNKEALRKAFNDVAVSDNPTLEMSVQLTFKRGEDSFLVSRSAQRKPRGKLVTVDDREATVYRNGRECQDPREWIEVLLPKMSREFFFFDGVDIQRYAQQTHTVETKNAIERILGIPELKNLRDDTERALKDLQKQLSDAEQTNEELQRVVTELETVEVGTETQREQLGRAKENLRSAQTIYEDTKQRAEQLEGLREKLDELRRLEGDRDRLRERLDRAEQQVEETLRKAPIPLLLGFVKEVANELQGQTVTTAKLFGSVQQLQKLLNSDRCVCGRCLDEEAKRYIQQDLEQLQRVKENSSRYGALEQDELRDRLSALSRYDQWNLEEKLLDRDQHRDDLDEIEQRISRLKRETHGINEEEARDIWRKVAEAERQRDDYQNKIGQFQRAIDQSLQREDELRRKMETLAGKHKETATLAYQVRLARGLLEATKELIDWRIEDAKATIEEKTSEVHRRVTNKPDEYNGVVLKENYTLGVRTVTGEVLNPETLSAGEKEALAFAFITGLNLASETSALLVMDTPFGHLDKTHQRNLVKALPDIDSQVIVLATDRDFPDPLLNELMPNVAGVRHIERVGGSERLSEVT